MKKQHSTDPVAPVKDELIFSSYNLHDLCILGAPPASFPSKWSSWGLQGVIMEPSTRLDASLWCQ